LDEEEEDKVPTADIPTDEEEEDDDDGDDEWWLWKGLSFLALDAKGGVSWP
jgi:hypothetical protein